MDPTEVAGAPGIEVTSEMVKAGLECALEFSLDEPSLLQLEQMVTAVFLAMLQMSPHKDRPQLSLFVRRKFESDEIARFLPIPGSLPRIGRGGLRS